MPPKFAEYATDSSKILRSLSFSPFLSDAGSGALSLNSSLKVNSETPFIWVWLNLLKLSLHNTLKLKCIRTVRGRILMPPLTLRSSNFFMSGWISGRMRWVSSMLTNALQVRSQPGTDYFVLSVCCFVWFLASLCYQEYSYIHMGKLLSE